MLNLSTLTSKSVFGSSITKEKELFLIDGNNYLKFLYSSYTSGSVLLKDFIDNFCRDYSSAKWFWDGEGYKERIQALYPRYKANRKYEKDYEYYSFREKITSDSRFEFHKRVPLEEADTQIRDFIVSNRIKKGCIFSSDADLLQLKKYGDFKFPYVHNRSPFKDFDPLHLCVYKVLVGDASDNIGGLEKFGPKAFSLLTDDEIMNIYNFFKKGEPLNINDKVKEKILSNKEILKIVFNIVHL